MEANQLSNYWGALERRQRLGLIAGFVAIVIIAASVSTWLLRDPMVVLAADLEADKMGEVTQEMEREKIDYRIDDAASAVFVPQSQLGRARAAAASGPSGIPASVGLELFKDVDFATTDFAQRVNYQRALQGELTRTIQTMEGVRSARVHVILPEAGLFHRAGAKASAAVSVAMQKGKTLTAAQIRGLQRLVAASVPEIHLDEVVVLDESGAGLTRAVGDAEGEQSSRQMDIKRQTDQYVESKLQRMLDDLVAQGSASVSVDATLDYAQSKVTTEEPLAAKGATSESPSGVLVKERQTQRGHAPAAQSIAAANDASAVESSDIENEYKVGQRTEQTISSPGSIKRLSVAVALHGAPASLTSTAVEQLVSHAAGIDTARGDSLVVVMLPAVAAPALPTGAGLPGMHARTVPRAASRVTGRPADANFEAFVFAILIVGSAVALAFLAWRGLRSAGRRRGGDFDDTALAEATATVKAWLRGKNPPAQSGEGEHVTL